MIDVRTVLELACVVLVAAGLGLVAAGLIGGLVGTGVGMISAGIVALIASEVSRLVHRPLPAESEDAS